ncbi:hypothetical protein, partial [Paractinoplanes deccanensis]|uniref:hypothetical protein n=1 Tax=Paractinoplanes deccanensis TaxID=113561 RepID=UPI003618CDA1
MTAACRGGLAMDGTRWDGARTDAGIGPTVGATLLRYVPGCGPPLIPVAAAARTAGRAGIRASAVGRAGIGVPGD